MATFDFCDFIMLLLQIIVEKRCRKYKTYGYQLKHQTRGQFHESKLRVNFAQLEMNLLSTSKTSDNPLPVSEKVFDTKQLQRPSSPLAVKKWPISLRKLTL